MKRRLAMLALGLAACRTATVPYPLERLPARPAVTQPRSIAILPFEDAREGSDREEEDDFVYRERAYRGTRLDRLRGDPGRVVAELFARHLAGGGPFSRVILVNAASDAPEAELVLSGRIRRARGYVEAEARGERDPAPAARSVLAEVWLEDVRVARQDGARVFEADLGWSIWGDRAGEPDPWAVLGEALFYAVEQGRLLLGAADLSGRFLVRDPVHLGARSGTAAPGLAELVRAAPEGWSVGTSTGTPRGWKGAEACETATFRQRQTQRFHRALGPYVPTVEVALCAPRARLRVDDRADVWARLLGRTRRGAALFVHTLGASSWPAAAEEVSQFFEARGPPHRHVFEVAPVEPLEE